MRQLPNARPQRQDWRLSGAEDPTAAEQYRAAVKSLFDIELHQPPAEFHNHLIACNFDAMAFGRCIGCAQTITRTRGHVRQDQINHVQVVLQLSGGWTADYDGRAADSGMGSLRVVDMHRPFQWRGDGDFETLNLMMPLAELNLANPTDAHGLVLSEDRPGAKLLASMMRGLWETLDELTVTQGVSATKAAAALLSGLIAEYGAPSPAPARPMAQVMMTLSKEIIDERLADPNLSPETLRRRLGVSRSGLYALFEPTGGVQAFIQDRRLHHAFDALARHDGLATIAEVGFNCGFRSPSHFSRAFRERFGISPGQFLKLRDEAPEPPPPSTDGIDDLLEWFKRMMRR